MAQPPPPTIPNPVTDFTAYQTSLFHALIAATKAANSLPSKDIGFYKSLDRTFATTLDHCAEQVLQVSNNLLRHSGGDQPEEYRDVDDVVDRYGGVIDVVDNLLEKADVCLDEYLGHSDKTKPLIKQSTPSIAQLPGRYGKAGGLDYRLIHAQNIVRPQLRFKDQVDNSANTPWIRKIKEKPNAKVPLDYGLPSNNPSSTLTPAMSSHILQTLGIGDELRSLPHPYEYEINHIQYPAQMFEQRPEQLYQQFDTTSATWVDTEQGLVDMCRKLEAQHEIAVDLEHHSYRSFQGFVCLMQVSTRDEDFVVDTLELRDKLWMLNQSFTDPNIAKIFHGAESDILWLQRDFGVYVVNLFDTYHASHLIELQSHSLASLLTLYCDVIADKQYQLADWRIRPLPTEMLKYARSDTHYLLYIYDRMRNELLQKSNQNHNLLWATLQRSQETALRRYEKESYDHEHGEGSNGWRYLYAKHGRSLDARQFAVYKAVHAWRDQTARDEDESTRYVLPNHMLFTLAERMPIESSAVIGCCTPCPPLVRMYAADLVTVVSRAMSSVNVVAAQQRVEIAMPKPVHTRFADEEVKEEAEGLGAELETERIEADMAVAETIVSMTRSSVLFDDEGRLRTVDLDKVTKRTSVLFEEKEADEDDSEARSRDLAKAIQASLVLTIPGRAARVKTATTGATLAVAPSVEPMEHLYTPAEGRTTKAKDKEVIVLSHLSSKAMKRQRTEEKREKKASAEEVAGEVTGDALAEDVMDLEDESEDRDEPDAPPKKNRKMIKRGKNKGKQAVRVAQNGEAEEEEAEEEAEEEEEIAKREFKAFDYSTASSEVVLAGGTEDRVKSKGGKKGKKGDKADKGAPFAPYSQIEEDEQFKKKDSRLPTSSKSGSRSMTFGSNQ